MASMWNRSVLTTLFYETEVHQWDKPWGLNIHGQRALSSLGVTLHAICRSTRLSPCLGGSSWQAPGAQHPPCPWGTEAAGGTECGGRGKSASNGAEPLEHRRCFRAQKGLLWEGRAGRQHCVCCTGHIHGNKARDASDPSRASRAVCSFPCLFALWGLNAWADLHK